MELDCGACQGSASGTASPGDGTTLEERRFGALVADLWGQAFQLKVGERLLPKPQALWALSRSFGSRSDRWTGT